MTGGAIRILPVLACLALPAVSPGMEVSLGAAASSLSPTEPFYDSAFLTPGMIRIQVSRMPDGIAYFCIARTIQKDSGGYHAQHPVQAIALGCQVEHARELVYSDGIDTTNPDTCVPVGVTCRLCERTDCEQRALPSLRVPLRVDENVRGV